jgi:hypothetical protein
MTFEGLECFFMSFGFFFVLTDPSAEGKSTIFRLGKSSFELCSMLRELDVSRLVIRNLLSKCRNDFRVFALLFGICLEFRLEITDVALIISFFCVGRNSFSSPRWQRSFRSISPIGFSTQERSSRFPPEAGRRSGVVVPELHTYWLVWTECQLHQTYRASKLTISSLSSSSWAFKAATTFSYLRCQLSREDIPDD